MEASDHCLNDGGVVFVAQASVWTGLSLPLGASGPFCLWVLENLVQVAETFSAQLGGWL